MCGSTKSTSKNRAAELGRIRGMASVPRRPQPDSSEMSPTNRIHLSPCRGTLMRLGYQFLDFFAILLQIASVL
jgi:hypothetical protein